MKNRPLFTVCLIVLAMIIIAVEGGGEKFIKELRLSPLERNVQEGDILTVCGRVYRIEQKETYRAIYLKDNSIQSESEGLLGNGSHGLYIKRRNSSGQDAIWRSLVVSRSGGRYAQADERPVVPRASQPFRRYAH